MKEMSLRESQMATKELLKQFDELCDSLGIRYFLMYGTLIGAIRHKGFIPWDDDLDVGMFYDDYQILCTYFKEHDNPIMELHNQETQKDCFYNIARICDKAHQLIFAGKDYKSGLFIDIYVMEGLGKEEDQPYWDSRFAEYDKWRKSVYICTNKAFLYGNGVLHKLANIPYVMKSKRRGKKYYIDQFNNHKMFSIEESDYIGVPAWETVRYPKDLFDETIRIGFEDITVSIPKQYDELLRIDYGDYMTPPPEKDRVPYHGYIAYTLED